MQRAQIGVAVISVGAVVAAALLAAPAAADWLVTRDGGRVETRGPWKAKGKLLVFTRADGQLSSLRLADVDLAASERATAEAVAKAKAKETAEAKPAPPPEKKEARWVMTDKDFHPAAPPAAKDDEAKPAAEETDAGDRPKLVVALENWDRKSLQDGLEISGTLRNPGSELAADIGVTIRLFDDTGALLATGDGRIAAPALGPGEAATFRATFPGVFTFAEAKFDTRGYGLRIKAATPAEAAPPP